jgi:hypothetical protein
MTNDGGRANEPTSYSLQPPNGPQVPPQSTPSQNTLSANSRADGPGYEPTRLNQPGAGAPSVGRLLGGRYRLDSRLGRGGMGTVWRAFDTVVEREVAVKEPQVPEHLGERERDQVYERMRREARHAAKVDHPAAVTIHDVVIEDDKPWIVMELVQGHSLADRLGEGTLAPREAARIGLAVLNALTAAHAKGVLHRDVKPDNILLGPDDRVVLSDFGIAQLEGEQGLTDTGAFVGSPEYTAPERVLGQHPGPESDLWSLGVVLYLAVEGVSPFRRSHAPATLQAVLSAEPQLPARGTGALGTLMVRLLRKDPGSRPDTAEIRQVLASVALPPSPTGLTQLASAPNATGPGLTRAQAWVPPVLHNNRKGWYGLGGGVLVVAVALVLLLANPFGGSGLPDGWGVRPENEILGAKVAVPDDYSRQQDDTGTEVTNVTYYDPSSVFRVYLERVTSDPSADVLEADRSTWKQYYEAGGEDGREVKPVEVTQKSVEHHGKKGFETVVDYTDPTTNDPDPYVYRWHELILPGDGPQDTYLRLRVSMPAEGWAEKPGEELFAGVVEHLDIQA